MAVRFRFGILETILVLVSVVAMPLVTELIGILINLKYPRFDADNDSVVVKQSASVMVATFLGLGMVLFTISLIFAMVFWMGQIMGLLVVDVIYVVAVLVLYFVTAARGEKKYLSLVA
jgi:ABC-2 type transport system permease protein